MNGNPGRAPAGGLAAQGVTLYSIAQVVVLVSGYAIHMVATRVLEPGLYGSLVVTLSVVAWVKVGIGHSYLPGAGKAVSEDPRRLAVALVTVGKRFRTVTLLIALSLAAAAPLLAGLFGDGALVTLLVVASLEIPFFAMYSLSRQVLAALRRFVQTAVVVALYGMGRALGACLLMLLGWSAVGGLVGLAAGSLLAGSVGLMWLHAARRDYEEVPYPEIMPRCRAWTATTLPAGAGLAALISLDMWLVKALVGGGAEVGIYGAAFAVSRVPFMLVQGLTETTFTRVSGALALGNRTLAQSVSAESMRFLLVIFIPLWSVLAGSAQELMVLLFGPAYRGSAVLLELLLAAMVLAAAARQMTALLAACDRPGMRLAIVLSLLPLALALNVLLIPRLGAAGGALASMATMAVGAVASGVAVKRLLGVTPPLPSLLRCAAAGSAVLVLGKWWSLSGWLVLLQCAALGTVYLGLLVLMRELHSGDLDVLARVFRFNGNGAS